MRDKRRGLRFAALAMLVGLLSQYHLMAGTLSPIGNFGFKIDQNLITLDNYANIDNIEAAIADGATGLEGSLAAAESMDAGLVSMWLPYTSILGMRETPGILLSNGVDSNLNIIGMEICLPDDDQTFMEFDGGGYYEKSYASGEYTYMDINTYDYYRVDPDAVPALVDVLDGGTRFVMSFGNGGMKPGRATSFKVKTSTGMYLHNFFDEDTQLKVTFQDPNTNEIFMTEKLNLEDIDEFNEDLVFQASAGTKNGMHFSEMVSPYWLGGEVIPEPTSMLLASSGLCCLVLRRRRVTL